MKIVFFLVIGFIAFIFWGIDTRDTQAKKCIQRKLKFPGTAKFSNIRKSFEDKSRAIFILDVNTGNAIGGANNLRYHVCFSNKNGEWRPQFARKVKVGGLTDHDKGILPICPNLDSKCSDIK